MPFTWEDIGYGFGVPVVVALFLLWNLRWMLPSGIARRYAPAVAFVAAFNSGYWLLKLGPYQPEIHWQWLPYLLAMAAIIGVVSAGSEQTSLDRFLLFSLASYGFALVLIPAWEGLHPPRFQYLIGWSVFVVFIAMAFQFLIDNLPGALLPFVFFLTCTSAAVLLTHSGSLLFGNLGIAAAGATLGILLAARVDKNSRRLDGLSYPLALYLCSAMMIGQTNSFSSIPIYAYAVIPFAPLGLFLTMSGPLSGFKAKKAGLIQILIPLLICAVALGIAFWFEPLNGEEI